MITLRNVVIAPRRRPSASLSQRVRAVETCHQDRLDLGRRAARPLCHGARLFKQALERQSNGRIEVQLFPNRQLGDEKPMLEGLRFGTLDAAVITNAWWRRSNRVPGQRPAVPVLERGQAHKVLDGKVGQMLAKKLEAKASSRSASWRGFRHMINNVRPVTKRGRQGRQVPRDAEPGLHRHVRFAGRQRRAHGLGRDLHRGAAGTIDGLEIR